MSVKPGLPVISAFIIVVISFLAGCGSSPKRPSARVPASTPSIVTTDDKTYTASDYLKMAEESWLENKNEQQRNVHLLNAAAKFVDAADYHRAQQILMRLYKEGISEQLRPRADTLTAPQAVFRLLGTPGDLLRGQAMALSVVLAAVVAVAVIASEMFSSDVADRSRTKSPVGS